MPAVFRCRECDEWREEDELADEQSWGEWVCTVCRPEECDCGERKCEECGPRMSESESDLVDMRKDGDA